MIFDNRACSLGEGPLWHPLRAELFWFDINACTLHSLKQSWNFDCTVTAAGWIDQNMLLVASDHGLHRFDIETGILNTPLVALEADNTVTRSNDGRADPWGGFWIGTMGRKLEAGAGAIYRYFGGDLRVIAPEITISNAISFTPDRSFAHYTDTVTGQIMRIPLEPDTGWPSGPAEVWLDLSDAGFSPDGAIVGTDGTFWLAGWGAGAVIAYDTGARETARYDVPGLHATCPAFGGADLTDLYVTSATDGLTGDLGDNGKTFVLPNVGKGQQEHQVIL